MGATTTFKQTQAVLANELFHSILTQTFPDIKIPKDYNSKYYVVYNGVRLDCLTGNTGFGRSRTNEFDGIKIWVSIGSRVFRRVMRKQVDLDPVNPTFSFDLNALRLKYQELLPMLTAYDKRRLEEHTKENAKALRVKNLALELGVREHDLEESYEGNKYRIQICETPEILKAVMALIKKMKSNA